MNRSLLLASSVVALLALGGAAQADSPREFLFQAQRGANSEIMLGRLAAEQARSPAVRQYGETLASDHVQARYEIRALGRRFGVWRSREITAEARETRDRLQSLRGREFDREFVRFMVDDHRKDIAEFREEAREGHGAVSDLARAQLPTLRSHLRMAIALERSDGRSMEGGVDIARERDDRVYGGDYNRPGGYNNWPGSTNDNRPR
ncbi:MAG TPA: DUF4142 domain-containing protein [Rhizomicrobium sp.]|nr:DUF4142 domain-containing protein [Rhizomicrobium sp.]